MNDVNILDAFKIVQQMFNGTMLTDFTYQLNGKTGNLPY